MHGCTGWAWEGIGFGHAWRETWALGSAAGCVYTQAQAHWSNREGGHGRARPDMPFMPLMRCSCSLSASSIRQGQEQWRWKKASSSGMREHQHRVGIAHTNLLGGQRSGEAALEYALLDRVAQLPPNATRAVAHYNCQTARIMQYWHRVDNGLISVTPSFRVQAGRGFRRGFRVRNSPTSGSEP